MVAVARDEMARADRPKRDDVAVKVDREVIRKANVIAAFRGQNLNEFLSETLGAIVDDLIRSEVAKTFGDKPKPGRSSK